MNSSIWNNHPEMVDALKALYRDNKSAGMIAQIINDRFSTDFSRNAIIGKINRLGLRPDAAKAKVPRSTLKQRRTAYHAVEAINLAIAGRPLPHIDPVKAPDPEPMDALQFAVTFPQLAESHCRWPVQDSPFLFCGAQKQCESPYCARHHAIAYQRSSELSAAERERRRRQGLRNFMTMRLASIAFGATS